jgi:hypothetical protein
MDPHVIAEMLSFNDDARQFLNLLHRQRAMSSRSIAAARERGGSINSDGAVSGISA